MDADVRKTLDLIVMACAAGVVEERLAGRQLILAAADYADDGDMAAAKKALAVVPVGYWRRYFCDDLATNPEVALAANKASALTGLMLSLSGPYEEVKPWTRTES